MFKQFFQLYLDSYRGLSRPSWMLALIMLINRSGAMVIPFLGIYMTQHLHFSLKETGTVLSCFGLGAVLGSLLGGWLTDRIGNFIVQVSSLFLSVPVFCLLPQLQTPGTLAIGVFVLSVVTETFRPANSVSLVSYAKPENITRAFSLNRMAINLGFSIGPAIGGFLASISYNWLFYGNAITAGAAGIVFFFYFRSLKAKGQTVKTETPSLAPGKSPWKDAPFLLFSLLCSVYAIIFFQILNTMPVFYRESHGLTEQEIGLLLAFNGMVVFLLEMILVHLAEKSISTMRVIVYGTLLCAFSFFMLLVPGLWALYFGMFLLSVSEILAMPFMSTVTMQRATPRKQGAYMGLNAMAFSIAHIASPLLSTGMAADAGYEALWITTGVASIALATGFWLVMRKW
ncbi:MAG: MFS transporter [Chitinophagaceae bacterium]